MKKFVNTKRLLCTILATASLLSFSVGAIAIEDEIELNVGVNQGVILPTAEEIQRSEEKAADMARLVWLLGLNQPTAEEAASRSASRIMTQSERDEAAAIMAKYSSVVNPNSVLEGASLMRANPVTKILNFTTTQQINGHYCGPASAYMVLKYEGQNVTQSGLAKELGTTTAGTDFGKNWETGMNYYSDHSYAVMWGFSNDSTERAIQMTDAAIGTIASGYGVIYDTIQYSGTSTNRLKGYPNYLASTIYHYVAGRGYSTTDPSNRVCYYTDPTNSTTYTDAYGPQTIGFRLMCTLIKDRGLVF